MNISGVGEMGVGETGVGETGQIIGETGVGEMGVGETGTSRTSKVAVQGIAKQRKEGSFRERKIFVRKEHFIIIVIDI